MEDRTVELITRTVLNVLSTREKNGLENPLGFSVPIGISARHIHLTQEAVEILFGKGYQLTKKKI